MELRTIEYQHFYTPKKEPRVTVCYLRFELHTVIGVAICSLKDRSCKKVGRAIAFQRALHAANQEPGNFLPVQRLEALAVIGQTDMSGVPVYKSEVHNDAKARYTREKRA